MSTKSIFAAIVLSTWAIAAQAQDAIAFKEFTIPDPLTNRPLSVGIWYPTTSHGPMTAVGENPVFYGVPAQTDAKPSDAAHPLVVLSHGYGGTWRNLSWVAQALVAQGYVVAAPNHPGTTAFNRNPEDAAKLWERPHDLTRVIDSLVEDKTIAGKIDRSRIAAIGHSLGGWTVAAIGGARSDINRYTSDCATHSDLRATERTGYYCGQRGRR